MIGCRATHLSIYLSIYLTIFLPVYCKASKRIVEMTPDQPVVVVVVADR